jgi:hypothetical protein
VRRDVRDRPVAVAVAAVVALTGLLAGCSGQDAGAGPSASSSSTPSPSATASATASATPSPTPTSGSPSATSTPSESPTATPSPTRVRGLADRLLPAADVPGLRPGARWMLGTTGPESPSSSFGTCQRFSALSIGAERALVRRYRPVGAGDDTAGELVAQLPDTLTARRAYAVLTAWRASCAKRLARDDRPTVGALQDVTVSGGSAGWYLLGYGPVPGRPGARYADAQGMVVVGDRLAMVSLRTVGSAAGVRKAMPRALKSAARLLR